MVPAEAFLKELFRFCAGLVEIRLLPSKRSRFFALPEGTGDAASFASGASGKEHVFFGAYPRAAEGGKSAAAVQQVQLLYADLDAGHFSGGTGEIDGRLAGFNPAPSAVVNSGGGRHAYWLLDRALKASPKQHHEVQNALWGVADALGVPPAKNTVHDLARVLRVPGTVNIKPEYGPGGAPCEVVLWEPERRYPPSVFHEFALRAWGLRARPGSKIPAFGASRPDPEAVLARLDLPGSILSLIRGGAPRGARSEADQKVITCLLARGATPDEIRAVFANAAWKIGAKYRGKGSDGDRYLARSVANARAWLEAEGEGPLTAEEVVWLKTLIGLSDTTRRRLDSLAPWPAADLAVFDAAREMARLGLRRRVMEVALLQAICTTRMQPWRIRALLEEGMRSAGRQ